MRNAFKNKVALFILSFFFLIIIVSMMFSGFNDNFRMTGVSSKDVASVDGTPITTREFQMALSRQMEFFNQMFGGNLTQKQMEEMGIKQQVLTGLIQQKLMLNASNDIGFVVSQEEIKNEIKNLPYFRTNNRFDVNLYRNMLQANGYIPAQFEDLVAQDLKQKKLDEVFNSTLVSENLVKDVLRFRNSRVKVHSVKISRQSLAPLITVSEQDLKAYLADPENQKDLEASYNENFAEYNQDAEVKVRHILVADEDGKGLEKAKAIRAQVTPKNFAAIAAKESKDPSGKDKGGDLGWVAKGRTVPDFEKAAFALKKGEISEPVKTEFGYHIIFKEDQKEPVTRALETVKEEIARRNIQKSKSQDLDQLLKSEEARLVKALEKNDLKAVEATGKSVNGQVETNVEVNQFDQAIGTQSLPAAEASKLFGAEVGAVVNLGNPGTIHLVKVVSKDLALSENLKDDAIKAELTAQNQAFSRKAREELVKHMNEKAKVVTNANLL